MSVMHKKHSKAVPSASTVEGNLQMKGRVGFVLSEVPGQTDVLVEGPTLRLAFDGDRVKARVTSGPGAPRRFGEIIEVVHRARETMVGAFARIEGHPAVTTEESPIPIKLLDLRGKTPGSGELVVLRITRWPTKHEGPAGVLEEILGPRSAPGVELKALIKKHNLPDAFPPEVEREAEAIGSEVSQDALQGRTILFDQRLFTIDGADAKDFDDAVSLVPRPQGGWRLGVHIADVAHYVREGTHLDREAYKRGTSVYLSGSVLPMLPFPLSDGLCSLRPELIRLTLTCELDIDPDGKIVSHRVFESAIRSHRRFTYEQVQTILDGQELPGLSPELHADVRAMGKLARQMRQIRFGRGSLDFDFPEAYVTTDLQGRPLDIGKRERLESHRLVEDFMLLANEAVAREMEKVPFLYRIHETPNPEKLEKLKKSLEAVGVLVPKGIEHGQPSALQKILKAVEGKPIQAMVHTSVLRSLKQAVYSPTNAGHYGLASRCYTHFTSPIRRYPDLVVHRLLKERLHHQATFERQAHWKQALPKIAQHTSQRERAAVDAEREFLDLQRVRFMEKHVGEEFDGVVNGVTAFGLFVQLKDYFVEGLVHISNLKGDYYVFDEIRMTLRGKRNGRTFSMGQPVRIQLAAANAVKRQLDFEFIEGRKPTNAPKPSGPSPRHQKHSHPKHRRRR